jgi:hypothetical protein
MIADTKGAFNTGFENGNLHRPESHIDVHIDIPLMSNLPYRYTRLISHIDIGSYLVTLAPPYRALNLPRARHALSLAAHGVPLVRLGVVAKLHLKAKLESSSSYLIVQR